MTQTIAAEQDFFPDLRNEPERKFVETGWGRFPIRLNDSGLNPNAFALYVRLSVMADTSMAEIPSIDDLAAICRMSDKEASEALETLKSRHFVTIQGENWTLTDPKTWL